MQRQSRLDVLENKSLLILSIEEFRAMEGLH